MELPVIILGAVVAFQSLMMFSILREVRGLSLQGEACQGRWSGEIPQRVVENHDEPSHFDFFNSVRSFCALGAAAFAALLVSYPAIEDFISIQTTRSEAQEKRLRFKEYLLYHSDLWFARTKYPRVKALMAAILVLVFVGTTFYNAATNKGFVLSFWYVWTFAADPGSLYISRPVPSLLCAAQSGGVGVTVRCTTTANRHTDACCNRQGPMHHSRHSANEWSASPSRWAA